MNLRRSQVSRVDITGLRRISVRAAGFQLLERNHPVDAIWFAGRPPARSAA
jgi:hypothetical protein